MKKTLALLLVLAASIILLTACNRPASVAPVPTATSEVPFPVANTPITNEAIGGTQTALATQNPPAAPTEEKKTSEPKATAEPKATLPLPTPGRPSTYTMKKGDHFLCLARRYNVNPNDLAAQNGYSVWPNTVVIGTVLKIPGSGSFPGDRALKGHPTTYTVVAGETINAIACKFGDVLPESILAVNGLKSSDIKSGLKLDIP
jgi:LysM repeat protein